MPGTKSKHLVLRTYTFQKFFFILFIREESPHDLPLPIDHHLNIPTQRAEISIRPDS